MVRAFAILLIAASLQAAGEPGKPPSEKADKALRERATQFYQLQIQEKFREAEQFVAPDTRDYFYGLNKIRYLSCELTRVEYQSEKQARVVMNCGRNIVFPGFAGQVIKMPVTGDWRIEKGKWFWYVDQKGPVDTPFGKMQRAAPGSNPNPSGMPFSIPTGTDFVLNKVKVDKTSLALKPGEAGELIFTNTAPGAMSLAAFNPPEKVTITPDRAALAQNEKATVKVQPQEGASNAVLTFRVEPTGEVISVELKVN